MAAVQSLLRCVPPSIARRLHVRCQHIAPRYDEWKQHEAHEAGVPGFSRGRVEPTGGPERKPDRYDPDGFPYELEEQEGQHLQWITKAQDGQQRDRRQDAPNDPTHVLQISRGMEYPRPDLKAESHDDKQICRSE